MGEVTTAGLEWNAATGLLSPVVDGETVEALDEPATDERNEMTKQVKKQLKKLRKGLVQDSLQGLMAPQAAGVVTATGEQSISPSTLGVFMPDVVAPTNGVPGVSASLQGGESPYIIPAEAGLDLTEQQAISGMTKATRKALRRAIKNSNNGGDISVQQMQDGVTSEQDADQIQAAGGMVQSKYLAKQMKKAAKDPIRALSRLELLSKQLRPNDPRRLQAAHVVMRHKLRLQRATEEGGGLGLVKGVASMSGDACTEVLGTLASVEQALGLRDSADQFSPPQIDPAQQLRRIVGGQASASLRGTQSPGSLTAYTSPAAALGQALKSSGVGEQLARAEAQLRKAEANGDVHSIPQLQERVTFLRLKSAHLMGR